MNDNEEATLPCDGKLVFNGKQEAQAAATTLEWQKGSKLKAYQCEYCDLWHLSTNHTQ